MFYFICSSEVELLTRLTSTMEISSVAPSASSDSLTAASSSAQAQAKANALASAHAATALLRLAPGENFVNVLRNERKVALLSLLLERCTRAPSGCAGAGGAELFVGGRAPIDGAPSDVGGGGGRSFGRRVGPDGLLHMPHFHIIATINAKTGTVLQYTVVHSLVQ